MRPLDIANDVKAEQNGESAFFHEPRFQNSIHLVGVHVAMVAQVIDCNRRQILRFVCLEFKTAALIQRQKCHCVQVCVFGSHLQSCLCFLFAFHSLSALAHWVLFSFKNKTFFQLQSGVGEGNPSL